LFLDDFTQAYAKHDAYGNEDGQWGLLAMLYKTHMYNRLCFAVSYESAAVQWYLLRYVCRLCRLIL
jgi:hypothetical protein